MFPGMYVPVRSARFGLALHGHPAINMLASIPAWIIFSILFTQANKISIVHHLDGANASGWKTEQQTLGTEGDLSTPVGLLVVTFSVYAIPPPQISPLSFSLQ